MKKELPYIVLALIFLVAAAVAIYFFKIAPQDGEEATTKTSGSSDSATAQDGELPVVDGATEGVNVGGGDLQGAQQVAPPNEQQAPQPLRTFDTSEGVRVEVFQEGEGDEAVAGKTVVVHYVGLLPDGTIFDTSLEREPFSFTLGTQQVISGWDIGVAGMKIGEIRRLTIPSEFGYGEAGSGEVIPPNSVLIFEVQLLAVQ
ncbi:MAG: peptidylprolyl isomerase [Candidatus Doudnabacteria bacterium CG10_big_fil_rev_8_21_14_0_10_41_10]|uniref:Peptidyl-prolyl cis-trans isomerase n=1 Tax=Candidatus Doudnabacteria bacterium CG10_big_fil_rev_8_21_14_0_10_41_10 TaxID=1974551 RepID=A0A2H0VEV3_9BACT|nr:MAG: peptidylprolyl isomerase [Candidatus Doudnabacteria bacterium CG10_big_fil_rev_8_21_14_0_10_41_10]